MNVFGLGPLEVLTILTVALLVFGPSRLAEIGATVGRALAELRRATADITRDLTVDYPHLSPDQDPLPRSQSQETPPAGPAQEETTPQPPHPG